MRDNRRADNHQASGRRSSIGIALLALLPIVKWLQLSFVVGWQNSDTARQVVLIVFTALVARALCGDWSPANPWQPGQPPSTVPAHRTALTAALWTVGPAVFVGAAIVCIGLLAGFENRLGDGQRMFMSGAGGRALFIALVIGFGEEYLFRGLLLATASRCGLGRAGFWPVSLSFAVWHIPDALPAGVLSVAATMVAMFGVSHLILIPLRRKTGNVLSPALVHAVNNVGLSFIAL
jgi:membrane protease YdiL (CAAX protease family)